MELTPDEAAPVPGILRWRAEHILDSDLSLRTRTPPHATG